LAFIDVHGLALYLEGIPAVGVQWGSLADEEHRHRRLAFLAQQVHRRLIFRILHVSYRAYYPLPAFQSSDVKGPIVPTVLAFLVIVAAVIGRPEKSTVDCGLVKDQRIFLVIPGVDQDTNNAVYTTGSRK
jgi:hypothetical protein